MQDDHANSETLLRIYLENDDKDKAVEMLYKLSVLSAKKKDFTRSEEFRDRIYEIDPMALPTIVGINEVIEEEKSKTLTHGFRQLWAPFFEHLSAEEANAFFFTLKEKVYDSDSAILEQGQPNDCLYLVNRGHLKVIYSDADKELLIQKLGRGDFFGQETCFSVNVCTASVITISEVSVSYVELQTLKNMKGVLNALDQKVEKVCCSGLTTFDRLRRKGIDRRAYKRINFNTQLSFQLLAANNQAAMQRSVKAELWDISKGGLSFYFQSKNRAAVRRLISQKLGMRLHLNKSDKSKAFAVTGVVHGVEAHPLDEYSVHVKLERNFSDAAIKAIKGFAER